MDSIINTFDMDHSVLLNHVHTSTLIISVTSSSVTSILNFFLKFTTVNRLQLFLQVLLEHISALYHTQRAIFESFI